MGAEQAPPRRVRVGQWNTAARAVLRPAERVLWPTRVEGRRNIPRRGGVILAPNHLSFLDSVLLLAVAPRGLTFLGKAEYLDDWRSRVLFPAVGMIPVDRRGGDASLAALDAAAAVLAGGGLMAIYPEGTRSRDGLLHRGRTGAARLALRTGSPLIPVGIVGTDRIQPPDARLPRPFRSCSVHFGQPLDIARFAGRAHDPRAARQLTDELMYEIGVLSGQAYVDRYAGPPRDRRPARDPPA